MSIKIPNCVFILRKLRIWSHLLQKSLMENFIFCAVSNCAIRSTASDIIGLPRLKYVS